MGAIENYLKTANVAPWLAQPQARPGVLQNLQQLAAGAGGPARPPPVPAAALRGAAQGAQGMMPRINQALTANLKHAEQKRADELDERKHPILHQMGQHAGYGSLAGGGLGALLGAALAPKGNVAQRLAQGALMGGGVGGAVGGLITGPLHGSYDLGRQYGRGTGDQDSRFTQNPRTTGFLLNQLPGALAAHLGVGRGRADAEKNGAEDAVAKFGLDKVANPLLAMLGRGLGQAGRFAMNNPNLAAAGAGAGLGALSAKPGQRMQGAVTGGFAGAGLNALSGSLGQQAGMGSPMQGLGSMMRQGGIGLRRM